MRHSCIQTLSYTLVNYFNMLIHNLPLTSSGKRLKNSIESGAIKGLKATQNRFHVKHMWIDTPVRWYIHTRQYEKLHIQAAYRLRCIALILEMQAPVRNLRIMRKSYPETPILSVRLKQSTVKIKKALTASFDTSTKPIIQKWLIYERPLTSEANALAVFLLVMETTSCFSSAA